MVLPDDIVGYTQLKNSSDTVDGTYANSSRNIMLYEPPRIALADVDAARILEPFSKSRDGLKLMLDRKLIGKVVIDLKMEDNAEYSKL